MVKKKTSKTSSLKKELAKLKKEKAKTLILKKKLLARKKEIEEIRELRREVNSLKGVGSNRRVAGQVAKKIGTDAGRVGWRGLKSLGKFAKNYLENEAREQEKEKERRRNKK